MYCSFFFSSRRRHTRYWRDWSSDVCSSDLDRCRDDRDQRDGGRAALVHAGEGQQERDHEDPAADAERPGQQAADHEIGRASCRERVKISAVAVSLKKSTFLSAILSVAFLVS